MINDTVLLVSDVHRKIENSFRNKPKLVDSSTQYETTSFFTDSGMQCSILTPEDRNDSVERVATLNVTGVSYSIVS